MPEDQLICNGCGAVIQTERENDRGYAPPSALERDIVICKRCYRLKHYGEVEDVKVNDKDFLKILNQVGETKALVVKIVDIFDFTGSWLSNLPRYVGNNDILLVGNKMDLLPQSTNWN